ncbi:DegQ family serine endoprotease [Suttonella sp. R2A3]|uniref:DegQ family serine endoprotease n=1 Tax=Suttonella sp. R2A3 TaxID=2908648 RepID=UPI001F3C9ACC|nr:DegQ family serine endoprotease [Suttonella sp. R2A3]UJF24442.1 DegQ family serine endoprotease [Suttonella sp. R2A3]
MNKTLVTIGLAFSAFAVNALADSAPDFAALFAQTKDAVVSVEVQTNVARSPRAQEIPPGFPPELFERFFGAPFAMPENIPEHRRTGQGSGFIIDKEGYILTNAHVVDEAESVKVMLLDRHEYDAEVVGVDQRTDIALLKIDGEGLPVASLGDSDAVQVGDWVLAIGSPFGFTHTATKGIVSAVSRSLPNGAYVPFIQSDAAVNPGNSGGPLYNSAGEVIGINSQIYSRSGAFNGLAFSIPINVAKNVVDQLRDGGTVQRGWLGVAIQGIDQELAQSFAMDNPQGALITAIQPDSPAKAAGLRAGDVILNYNGKSIHKYDDLPPLVALTPIGEEAELTVLRDGEKQSLAVTIGNLENMSTANASDSRGQSAYGLNLRALTEQERQQLNVEDGVLVRSVEQDSAAYKAGVRANDVLLALGSQVVSDSDAAYDGLKSAKGQVVALLIKRGEQTLYIPMETKE